jgi:lactoylglutathione lyase
MNLGQFSISLAVADLAASRAFYEQLGFTVLNPGGTYVMMKCGDAVIGLFQGLFDRNTLTFNPPDVRRVQAAAKAAGVTFAVEATGETGPAHAMALDPDGNPVLFDQH